MKRSSDREGSNKPRKKPTNEVPQFQDLRRSKGPAFLEEDINRHWRKDEEGLWISKPLLKFWGGNCETTLKKHIAELKADTTGKRHWFNVEGIEKFYAARTKCGLFDVQ